MVRLAPLLAAAFFLLAGSVTLYIDVGGLEGIALICAGLITLGAYIATEAYHSIAEGYKRKNDTPE